MRKKNIMIVSFMFLFIFTVVFPGITSAKAKPIAIVIDEVKVAYTSQNSQIINGVSMVSYIPVLKQMNANYEWNAKKKLLTINKDNKKLQLTIGNKKAFVNNKEILLDAQPQIVKGNVYIPVKSVFLAFDGEVEVYSYSDEIKLIAYITDEGKMLKALEDNDYNKVKNFIDKGIDLNYTHKTGENFLHRAAAYSSSKIVQLLIDNNVSTNQLDKYDTTPLYSAIRTSKKENVKVLLPYTDLSFKNPVTKYSHLEFAESRLDFYKNFKGATDEDLKNAEAIVTYIEEAMASQSLITSPKYPTAMGETAKVTVTSNYNNKKLMGITVDKVLRGNQAWKKIVEASSTNAPPAEGKEYIAILVRADLSLDSQEYRPDDYDFDLFDTKGNIYFRPMSLSEPLPQFILDYYVGENKKNLSNWLVYSIPENFPIDELVLGYKTENKKSLAYFKLVETKNEEVEYSVDLSQLSLPSSISSMPNEAELKTILQQNFSRLSSTSQGDIPFEFKVYQNEYTTLKYDFSISTVMDFSTYYNLRYSNSITKEQREVIFQQLKDYQEKIGQTLVALYPNVKFSGSYHDTWYKYPKLEVGIESYSFYEWSNYDYVSFYETSKPTFFRWTDTWKDSYLTK